VFTNEHTLEDSYSIAYDDTIPPIYDDCNDVCDIFSPPTIEEKIRYDYNTPPIFDDYGDENNIDRYVVEFAPTMITRNDYVYMGSINSFMHVVHDKNVLCDSYVVNSIHDATGSYYERGKYGFMHLNNIKFHLIMLKFLKLHLFCFLMLVVMCFHDLFLYKTLFS
jgi:ATP sulfurylase